MTTDDNWVRLIATPLAAISVAGIAHATEYLSVEQAQQLMFGRQARFERRDVAVPREVAREIESAVGVQMRLLEQPMWEVREAGRINGYFFVDEVYGKHEFITYALGLNTNGRVRQLEVLTYRENYGYEIRNPAWRAQFIGKTSAEPFKLDNDIKNISGATLSCRHVTDGVKRLLLTYDRLVREN